MKWRLTVRFQEVLEADDALQLQEMIDDIIAGIPWASIDVEELDDQNDS